MKLKLHLLLLALCGMFVLQSCEKEDDIPAGEQQVARNAFEAKYPTVKNAHWEMKRNYCVAEFYENGREMEAWFTTDGTWSMTETDLGMNTTLLPEPVQAALATSAYASWRVDDIDLYERPDKDFYLIEVETKGQPDHDLFFAPDGTLIKAEKDRGDIYPNTNI